LEQEVFHEQLGVQGMAGEGLGLGRRKYAVPLFAAAISAIRFPGPGY
jgi:hypothetical protein